MPETQKPRPPHPLTIDVDPVSQDLGLAPPWADKIVTFWRSSNGTTIYMTRDEMISTILALTEELRDPTGV